jgi:DnaK suppressor protein
MKKKDMQTFETLLLSMKAEIESNMARLWAEREAISTETDIIEMEDEVSLQNESVREAALLKQQRHELEEIEHALAKIKNGTYGICEIGGDAISLERLRAIPYARNCIEDERDARR